MQKADFWTQISVIELSCNQVGRQKVFLGSSLLTVLSAALKDILHFFLT